MSKIGILGGCFNPIHIAHTWIAQQVCEDRAMDKIWILPSYNGESSNKINILPFKDRYKMCELATKNFKNMEVKDIESKYKFEYTYQTVNHVNSSHDDIFYFIVGGDVDVTLFKQYESCIKDKIDFIKVARHHFFGNYRPEINLDISSTIVRDRIKHNQVVDGLVHPDVDKYIKKHNLYI